MIKLVIRHVFKSIRDLAHYRTMGRINPDYVTMEGEEFVSIQNAYLPRGRGNTPPDPRASEGERSG